jgi:hypothetical protein
MSQLVWNDVFGKRFDEGNPYGGSAGGRGEFAAPKNDATTGGGGVGQH